MTFSISKTTVNGLNFNPYFFQLCYHTQAPKTIKSGGQFIKHLYHFSLKMEVFRLSYKSSSMLLQDSSEATKPIRPFKSFYNPNRHLQLPLPLQLLGVKECYQLSLPNREHQGYIDEHHLMIITEESHSFQQTF